MRIMMSAECGLPAQQGRNKRNTDLLLPLLLGGAYDPTSIWYQYFLCKTQDIYCYFFTQGWTQADYGQYYLYDNLLDDADGLFAGATDSNLATLALLGGLGGGDGGYGQPAPYYGYAQPTAPTSRKRRGTTGASGSGNPCVPECRKDDKKCEVTCRDGRGFTWLQNLFSSIFGGDDEDDEDEDEDEEDDDDDEDEDEDDEDEDEDEDDEEDDEDEDEEDEDEDEEDEDEDEEDED